jgi:hypothetical protein
VSLLQQIEAEAAAITPGGPVLLTPPDVHALIRKIAEMADERPMVGLVVGMQYADGDTGSAYVIGPGGDVAHLTHLLGRLTYRLYAEDGR